MSTSNNLRKNNEDAITKNSLLTNQIHQSIAEIDKITNMPDSLRDLYIKMLSSEKVRTLMEAFSQVEPKTQQHEWMINEIIKRDMSFLEFVPNHLLKENTLIDGIKNYQQQDIFQRNISFGFYGIERPDYQMYNSSLQFIPEELRTEKVCKVALDTNPDNNKAIPNDIKQVIYDKILDEVSDPNSIQEFANLCSKNPFLIWDDAIPDSITNNSSFWDRIDTEFFENKEALQFVPKEARTSNICKKALDANTNNYYSVPKHILGSINNSNDKNHRLVLSNSEGKILKTYNGHNAYFKFHTDFDKYDSDISRLNGLYLHVYNNRFANIFRKKDQVQKQVIYAPEAFFLIEILGPIGNHINELKDCKNKINFTFSQYDSTRVLAKDNTRYQQFLSDLKIQDISRPKEYYQKAITSDKLINVYPVRYPIEFNADAFEMLFSAQKSGTINSVYLNNPNCKQLIENVFSPEINEKKELLNDQDTGGICVNEAKVRIKSGEILEKCNILNEHTTQRELAEEGFKVESIIKEIEQNNDNKILSDLKDKGVNAICDNFAYRNNEILDKVATSYHLDHDFSFIQNEILLTSGSTDKDSAALKIQNSRHNQEIKEIASGAIYMNTILGNKEINSKISNDIHQIDNLFNEKFPDSTISVRNSVGLFCAEKINKGDEYTKLILSLPERIDNLRNSDNKYLCLVKQLNTLNIDINTLKERTLNELLKGHKSSDLISIPVSIANIKIETKARLQLKEKEDGFILSIYPQKKSVEEVLEKPFMGHIFSKDEINNLLTLGNAGTPIAINEKGINKNVLVSVDKLTNDIVAIKQDDIKIPDNYNNIKFTQEQKTDLINGKPIVVKDIKSSNNAFFSGLIQYNAEKKNVELLQHGLVVCKVNGVQLNRKQQVDLSEGKTIFLSGILDKTGEKYNARVRLDVQKQTLVTKINIPEKSMSNKAPKNTL